MVGIAILVGDEDYAEGLERYLTADCLSGDISFGIYTQIERFERFIKENKPNLIFAEEGFDTDEYGVPCVWLTGGSVTKEDDTIGMYRSLDSVAKDIIRKVNVKFGQVSRIEEGDALMTEIFAAKDDSADHINLKKDYSDDVAGCIRDESSARITSVCSPIGGVFSSTFAFALASYHSKGTRTLFVSFDPFFEVVGQSESDKKRGIGKLIYLLDSGRDYVIEKCTQRIGGLDCIFGADHWTDICDMKKEHATELLNLADREGYKNIIFDIKLFGAASIPLLKSSQKVMVPYRNPEILNSRIDEWKRQLALIGVGSEIVSCFEVPYDGLVSKGCEPLMLLKGRLGRFVEETEGMHYVR